MVECPWEKETTITFHNEQQLLVLYRFNYKPLRACFIFWSYTACSAQAKGRGKLGNYIDDIKAFFYSCFLPLGKKREKLVCRFSFAQRPILLECQVNVCINTMYVHVCIFSYSQSMSSPIADGICMHVY